MSKSFKKKGKSVICPTCQRKLHPKVSIFKRYFDSLDIVGQKIVLDILKAKND